jgi:phosphoglucosamine mutase
MTRKYFGTDGIRGKFGANLINPEFVLKLGWALGRVLGRESRRKVLIGKDTRISGYLLESALEAGLSAAGVDIHLLGPMPTPAIAYLTRTFRAQAGIVISASHNPYSDNGIKFFGADGCKLADSVELAIEEQLEHVMQTVSSEELGKALRLPDAPGRYIEFCKSTIPGRTTLAGLKIVIDCANGATYHIAPSVFTELGAKVIELATQPDGFNINADCGAIHPQWLQKAVRSHQADLGIAFDGDGDRVIMVDRHGNIVDGDELLFIIVNDQVAMHEPVRGVVGTVMSNYGLERAFSERKIEFVRSRVGDRHVQAELLKRGWTYGGEPSGHILCLNKTTTGDAIIAALQVLTAMRRAEKGLAELTARMQKLPQVKINIKSKQASKVLERRDVQSAIAGVNAELNKKGRLLIRPSGTEPLIRIMLEGEDEPSIHKLAHQLAEVVESASQSHTLSCVRE